ncbi:MAG TPA: hypothetical protein VI979_00155 [archaeon]|nr:hypothetical protein [archaeon]
MVRRIKLIIDRIQEEIGHDYNSAVIPYAIFSDKGLSNLFGPNFFGDATLKKWWVTSYKDAISSFREYNPKVVHIIDHCRNRISEIEDVKGEVIYEKVGSDLTNNEILGHPVLERMNTERRGLEEIMFPALYTAYRHMQSMVRDNHFLLGQGQSNAKIVGHPRTFAPFLD